MGAVGESFRNLPLHRRQKDFIGIEKQHPGGWRAVMAQEPVALLGETAVPVEMDDLRTMAAGHGNRGVSAGRIDHHHLAGEVGADGLQACGEVAFLVSHGDGDGEVQGAIRHGDVSKEPSRIASHKSGGRNLSSHHTAGTHDRPLTHCHTRQQKGTGPNERIPSDADRRRLQRSVEKLEVVRACAEISLLSHTGSGVNLDLAKAIGVSPIPQTGLVVKREIPWMLNPSPLMNKGLPMDGGAKALQDEEAPGIERLGGPGAEQQPGVLPEQDAQAVTEAPGTGVATGLAVGL